MAVKQQGASITFGTDGGSWKFTQIGSLSAPIPVLDDTDLSVTNRRTKMPGDLEDVQPITIQVHHKPNSALPTKKLVQTITITSPLSGFTNAENWAGTGFVTDIKTPEFKSDSEGLQITEITFIYDGKTGPARTAASN